MARIKQWQKQKSPRIRFTICICNYINVDEKIELNKTGLSP